MGPPIVFILPDTGDSDGVNAVVRVVHPLFLRVLVLEPPFFPESRRRCTLNDIDFAEECLQVKTGIPADNPNFNTLPVGEPFGNLCHREAFVLPLPIVQLHLQVMHSADGSILCIFCLGCSGFSSLERNLARQILNRILPSGNPLKYDVIVNQFGWNLRFLDFAVELVLTKRLVRLGIIAAPRARNGMLDIEFRNASEKHAG